MSIRTLGVAVLTFALNSAASATSLLVPAYFYPSFDPAQNYWNALTAAAAGGAQVTAIMNPDNGPGTTFNSDYEGAISGFRAAGGKVLGYVYTCYGGANCVSGLPSPRTTNAVLADAARYADWYKVDGIFLDEMSNQLAALPFYQTLAQGLRSARPDGLIVGNPGTSAPLEYLGVADTLVTLENGSGSYAGAASEPWMATAAAQQQASLFYNVASADAMRALVAEARARKIGYVYITDDRYVPGDSSAPNPWDRLPTYWAAELTAVASVPEPSMLSMLLGGSLLMGIRRLLR